MDRKETIETFTQALDKLNWLKLEAKTEESLGHSTVITFKQNDVENPDEYHTTIDRMWLVVHPSGVVCWMFTSPADDQSSDEDDEYSFLYVLDYSVHINRYHTLNKLKVQPDDKEKCWRFALNENGTTRHGYLSYESFKSIGEILCNYDGIEAVITELGHITQYDWEIMDDLRLY